MQVLIDFAMTTDGVLSKQYQGKGKRENNRLSFMDEENNLFSIHTTESGIVLERSGVHPLKIPFLLGQTSFGTLYAEGNSITFQLYTNYLLNEESHLEIHYEISDERVIFSRHQIKVVWNN